MSGNDFYKEREQSTEESSIESDDVVVTSQHLDIDKDHSKRLLKRPGKEKTLM